MCQVTSNPYSDSRAVVLSDEDFSTGSLRRKSYARPGKLFTANNALIVARVGALKADLFERIIQATVRLLQARA